MGGAYLMPMAAPKRCPGANGNPCSTNRLIPNRLPRCPQCQRLFRQANQIRQMQRRPTMRSAFEIERRKGTVDAHVAVYGWVCLGDEYHQAHATRDLTADHVPSVAEQVAAGVAPEVAEAGPLTVTCQHRNSNSGDRIKQNLK